MLLKYFPLHKIDKKKSPEPGKIEAMEAEEET